MLMYQTCAGLAIVLGYIYLQYNKSKKRAPPGPRGLPLLGNVHQINVRAFHKTFYQWAQRYGDAFTFYTIGRRRTVVVNSVEQIRSILSRHNSVFHDRADPIRIAKARSYSFSKGKGFLDHNYTTSFKQQKKEALRALKFYGDGLDHVEIIARDVISDYLRHIATHHGQPFLLSNTLYIAVANVITSMVLGKRFGFENKKMLEFKRAMETFVQAVTAPRWQIFDVFPFLRRMLPFVSNIRTINQTASYIDAHLSQLLQPITTNDSNHRSTCFAEKMYAFTKPTEDYTTPLLDEHDFTMVVFDVMKAGFLTTTSTLSATVLIFMNHPDVEARVVKEIDDVIGTSTSGKLPALHHKDEMPYTNATILEILRYTSIAVFGIPHYTRVDADICDGRYTIPAKTGILVNLWYLHHDESLWDEPWTFKPERFLDASGKLQPPGSAARKHLLPFGMGPRACLGEVLAKNRLFLFITSMYQRYRWLPPDGQDPPSCDPRDYVDNFLIRPQDFLVKVEERCDKAQ